MAARLLGWVEAMEKVIGLRLAPRERAPHTQAVARARDQRTVVEAERAFVEGARMYVGEAVGLALGLGG